MTVLTILKKPSAFLPVAMSLAALALVAAQLVRYGSAPQADEGATAHLWQLLMAAQLPILLVFAMKWLPQAPKQALSVLALQAGVGIAALAPVFLLHW